MKIHSGQQRANARFNESRLYGRLGMLRDVKAQAATAQTSGASVKWDRDAGTCEVLAADGATMFRALQKGQGSAVWLVMYNPFYYPRDDSEREASAVRVTELQAAQDSHCGFFLRSADGSRVIGSDCAERTGADQVAIIALPKFRDVDTIRAFVRWTGLRLSQWQLQSMQQA